MRCPSCNKLPAKYTDTEPEGDLEVDDTGMVTGEIRIVNTSECCGEELEETNFNVEIDLTDEVGKHIADKHPQPVKPKNKPKLPPLYLTDPWRICKNCKRGFRTHIDPTTKKQIGEHHERNKWPKDARKCRCFFYPHEKRSATMFEPKGSSKNKGEFELSIDTDIERTDETPRVDRNGKTIKISRYMKRFYGIVVNVTLHCNTCKKDIVTGSFVDHVQASGMDSLV